MSPVGFSGSRIYPFWSLGVWILKRYGRGGFEIVFMDRTRDLALLWSGVQEIVTLKRWDPGFQMVKILLSYLQPPLWKNPGSDRAVLQVIGEISKMRAPATQAIIILWQGLDIITWCNVIKRFYRYCDCDKNFWDFGMKGKFWSVWQDWRSLLGMYPL